MFVLWVSTSWDKSSALLSVYLWWWVLNQVTLRSRTEAYITCSFSGISLCLRSTTFLGSEKLCWICKSDFIRHAVASLEFVCLWWKWRIKHTYCCWSWKGNNVPVLAKKIISVVTMQHQELVFCVLQKVSVKIKQSGNDAGQCFGIMLQCIHLCSKQLQWRCVSQSQASISRPRSILKLLCKYFRPFSVCILLMPI